jgi:release factor glutamine methyltransferase
VANLNASSHGVRRRVHCVAGDLLEPVRTRGIRARCVAANLPYVASPDLEDLEPGIRDHEPRIAIDGGPDGLTLVRRLARQAPDCLEPAGLLALEVADEQAREVMTMLRSDGAWAEVGIRADLGRLKRVVLARRG